MADTATIAARKAVAKAFSAVGPECVNIAREMLGIPVEGTGRHKIRSKPGESPRKEFGLLQANTNYRVDEATTTLEIFWTSPVATILDSYGPRGNGEFRPIIAPLKNILAEKLPDMLAAKIQPE